MIRNIKNYIISLLWRRFSKSSSKTYYHELLNSLQIPLTKELTEEQIDEIQSFYQDHWGKKLTSYDLAFHKAYYNITGLFSPKYIPTSLYRSDIIYRLNDFRMKNAYADKNILSKLFGSLVKQPKVYIRCINGVFYSEEYDILTREKAIAVCSNIPQAIIKPSIETTHGDDVFLFSSENGVETSSKRKVADIFDGYGSHFIVQEKQSQHSALSKLNESSLNTIRVITYWRECGEIVPLYAIQRIGKMGKTTDNVGSGGINVKINWDGKLDQYASVGNSGKKTEVTDSGIVLHNYMIPSVSEVITTCLRLHSQLPYFSLVAWDMAVDENANPVLIEWNVSPDLLQDTLGPAFGEYTEEILTRARNARSTRPLTIDGKPFRK